MSASIETLIPELQPYAREFVDTLGRLGLGPRITSTRRSHAEQTRLYRRYLAGLQPYYVAPPGTSPHEFGWAFDLVTSPMDGLDYAGQIWESWGGYWGGRQADPVHFQYPGFHQRRLVPDVQASSAEAVPDWIAALGEAWVAAFLLNPSNVLAVLGAAGYILK